MSLSLDDGIWLHLKAGSVLDSELQMPLCEPAQREATSRVEGTIVVEGEGGVTSGPRHPPAAACYRAAQALNRVTRPSHCVLNTPVRL
ncbi:hypothetical protein D4764_13G0004760, partial [Takifugu flavidus]